MATSTFEKQFKVEPHMVNDFVKEMTKKVTPTLEKDFCSQMKHEKDLREKLQKALK